MRWVGLLLHPSTVDSGDVMCNVSVRAVLCVSFVRRAGVCSHIAGICRYGVRGPLTTLFWYRSVAQCVQHTTIQYNTILYNTLLSHSYSVFRVCGVRVSVFHIVPLSRTYMTTYEMDDG